MHPPTKQRVREAFERAAATYDGAAEVQRRICHALAAGLATAPARTLLDAGCGTGYALPLLGERFPGAALLALDLSPAMLGQVAGSALRLAGDAERLPLADASVDVYWSSLALQWCDLAAALAEARRVLAPGGRLAVATLGPATFGELRTAFAAADGYRHTLSFHSAQEVAALAAAAGFRAPLVRPAPLLSQHPDLRSLLRAVKSIGANQVGSGRRTGLMSRGAWQRAEAAYEGLRTDAGLPLTYDTLILHAQK